MTNTTTRTLADRAGAIRRLVRALGRDPAEWDLGDLAQLSAIEAQVKEARDRAIYALRSHGATDAEIAAELGTTRQAVSKRWPGGGRYVGAAGRFRTTQTNGGNER